MTKFWIQFRKDFCAYFSHLNAYIVLGCYCFLSFITALYLGNYFLRETNPINSYISLQPFILMLFIPALTMRSWTDEIKSGTLELLLTQPISYTTLVFAKFCAAFAFFNLMIFCSVPFLIITSFLSFIDWNAVFLAYCGLWLCGLFFTALGCMISACQRNSIICYLSTIFVLFIVIEIKLVPLSLFQTVFSLDYLCFDSHYNAFLNGVFSWVNVLYFVVGTILCLWLNVIFITCQRDNSIHYRKKLAVFILLVLGIFVFIILGVGYSFTNSIDMTQTKKYTLSAQSVSFLKKNNKRIDITLYESKDKREDTLSGYAIYAAYVEQFLALIERASLGSIRTEIVYVEPFSNQERVLMRRSVPYSEDSFGHKIFLVADFTDNEGNFATIDSFNPLRQDLLEADVIRTLRRFSLPKRNVAVIAPTEDWSNMNGLKNVLNEFYTLTHTSFPVNFIPSSYSAVLVINPNELSTEFLLAMEQYILNGGTLLIFADPTVETPQNALILKKFIANYGIIPLPENPITYTENGEIYAFGPAYPTDIISSNGIRSVLVNKVGSIDLVSSSTYKVSSLLTFSNAVIAAKSSGHFISDYLQMAATEESIKPLSQKDGSLFFFYDTDFLKDYIYLTEDSSSLGFYENIPIADNLLFILRLLDFSLQENIENNIYYKHSVLNISSIGEAILKSVKERYQNRIEQLEYKVSQFNKEQKSAQQNFISQGLLSAKNLANSYDLAQSLEEAQDKLGQAYATVFDDYRLIVVSLSILFIFIIPIIFLILIALIVLIHKRLKLYRIRRLISNAQTS